MKIYTLIVGIVFATAGISGVIYDWGDGLAWVLLYVALSIHGLVIIFGALRLRISVVDGTLCYRGYISNLTVPIAGLTGVFTERYDGGVFFFLNGPRFLRVIVIQGEFGVKQLDGTAGRERKVQRIKQAILECMPEDHPQRKNLEKGPGGAHR